MKIVHFFQFCKSSERQISLCDNSLAETCINDFLLFQNPKRAVTN